MSVGLRRIPDVMGQSLKLECREVSTNFRIGKLRNELQLRIASYRCSALSGSTGLTLSGSFGQSIIDNIYAPSPAFIRLSRRMCRISSNVDSSVARG